MYYINMLKQQFSHARAFGAYPDRTERHLVPFRARDIVFVLAFLAVSTAVFATTSPWTLA